MEQNRSKQYGYTPIQIILFFVLTFLFSWSIMIPWAQKEGDPFPLAFAGYSPFLAAVIVIGISKGRTELRHWLGQIFRLRIHILLYLAGAFLLPLIIGGLQYSLYRVLGGQPYFSAALVWDRYLENLIVAFLLFGGNEELGWRGFALPALLERFHPLLAALVLGVIHTAWHLPLLSHYGVTFGWYLFNVVPLTVILNWFYLKSHKSVIPVMLLHASTNVIDNFVPPPPMIVLGGAPTSTVVSGMVYWVMAIVIVILTKGRLGTNSNRTQLGD